MNGEAMTFKQALDYAQGPGVAVIVGVIISLLVELWPAFCALDPKRKRLAVGGLSLAVPLVACLLACLMAYQPWAFETSWWPALVSGGAAFGAATLAHLRLLPGQAAS
jgi:hypothetical protein